MENLAGVAEIAAMLGVTTQRVDQLAKSDIGFPRPVAELSAGRIWERADVEAWAKATGRLKDKTQGRSTPGAPLAQT